MPLHVWFGNGEVGRDSRKSFCFCFCVKCEIQFTYMRIKVARSSRKMAALIKILLKR